MTIVDSKASLGTLVTVCMLLAQACSGQEARSNEGLPNKDVISDLVSPIYARLSQYPNFDGIKEMGVNQHVPDYYEKSLILLSYYSVFTLKMGPSREGMAKLLSIQIDNSRKAVLDHKSVENIRSMSGTISLWLTLRKLHKSGDVVFMKEWLRLSCEVSSIINNEYAWATQNATSVDVISLRNWILLSIGNCIGPSSTLSV